MTKILTKFLDKMTLGKNREIGLPGLTKWFKMS